MRRTKKKKKWMKKNLLEVAKVCFVPLLKVPQHSNTKFDVKVSLSPRLFLCCLFGLLLFEALLEMLRDLLPLHRTKDLLSLYSS